MERKVFLTVRDKKEKDRRNSPKVLFRPLCKHLQNYQVLHHDRFFVGGTIHGVWSIMFTLASEITVSKSRGITGGVLSFGNPSKSDEDSIQWMPNCLT